MATIAVFLLYAWPGYVGWDTLAHLLMVRSGVYTDGHPPAIAAMWRVVELVVTGPAGMLLIQTATLYGGLSGVFAKLTLPRAAAIATAAVFLFPPVAGVTAIVVKDALMAGFIMVALALMLDERTSRNRLALLPLVAASAMRWNALAATFPPCCCCSAGGRRPQAGAAMRSRWRRGSGPRSRRWRSTPR